MFAPACGEGPIGRQHDGAKAGNEFQPCFEGLAVGADGIRDPDCMIDRVVVWRGGDHFDRNGVLNGS
jgi:hypothetical protein